MSMSRHCAFYKAQDGSWWMELAAEEHAGSEDATTYGPFASKETALRYLGNFVNPGSYWIDESGESPRPTVSPNGSPIQQPRLRRW